MSKSKIAADLLRDANHDIDKARLLASTAPHSADWLLAPSVASIGLRPSNEAIRISVGVRLGFVLCEPHVYVCGKQVDARGLHGLSCRRSAGRQQHHAALNDIIWRSLQRANIQATKEPSGLLRGDGKRPDGVTLIPWSRGKSLA